MHFGSFCVSRGGRLFLTLGLASIACFAAAAYILTPSSLAQRAVPQPDAKLGSTIGRCDSALLEVEANGLSTPYSTLSAAFLSINNGVHTGEIVIEACGDTAHTGSAVINSSGALSANYSHITLRPLVDGVRITGTPAAGKGVIELNGADNITIDGDNPLTPGTNRDLTIENLSASNIVKSQVIRIALNPSTVLTADNNTFKNLNLIGNAKNRNISADFSATGSLAGTSLGILVSAGAVGTTSAPSEITSPTTKIGGSATAANLNVINNSIMSVGRAISVNGDVDTVAPGLVIRGNTIGNPAEGELDQVYVVGVTVQGSVDALIEANEVWIESYVNHQSGGIRGLDHGMIDESGEGTQFLRNKIGRVRNRYASTGGATGINIERGTNHKVINNFVSGVMNENTGNAFNQTTSAAGIRIGNAGSGHEIFHNSVHLTGTMNGTNGAAITSALTIGYAGTTDMVIRNNIFSNQISGGHSSTRHVSIAFLASLFSNYRLIIDNNAYFSGATANSRLAQVGLSTGQGEYHAENFSSSDSSNSTNLRTYTYSLTSSSIHENDSGSFATIGAPPFVSDTDLHLVAESGFQVEAGGADVGVAADIDGHSRDASPEIGADELFAPTSAGVTLAGRVATAGGRGIYGARVALTGPGGTAYAVTNPFGHYRFTDVPAGSSAVISVTAKGRTFATPSRMITVDNDLFGIDFIAEQ